MSNYKYHFIYKTTNNINGKYYIGVHNTNNIDDGYLGSGIALNHAINKYGIINFNREILEYFKNAESTFDREKEIVNEYFITRKDTYNMIIGGNGGGKYLKNKVSVKDKNGNTMQVNINDERYLNGELIGVRSNLVTVKDQEGNTLTVSVTDDRYLNGKLSHINCGKIVVKDINGITSQVSTNDPKYISGELVHIHTGNIPKQLTCPFCKKTGDAGNMTQYHFKYCKNNPNQITKATKNMKLVTCPFCGKVGSGGAMTQFHFDNCKKKLPSN